MRARTPFLAALSTATLIAAATFTAAPALADTDPALTNFTYPTATLTAGESTTPTFNDTPGYGITHFTGCVTTTLDATTLTTVDYTDTGFEPANFTATYDDIYALPGATRHSTYTVAFYENIACTNLTGATPITATVTLGYPTTNILTSAHYTRTDISVGETAVMELNLAGGSQQVEHYTGCVTETIDDITVTTTPYTDATLHSADFDRTYTGITAMTGAQPDSTYTVAFYEHIACTDIAGETPTQTQTLTLIPPTVITTLAWSDPDISTGDTSRLIINGTDTTVRGWTGCIAPNRIHDNILHNWATTHYNNDYAWTTDTDFTVSYAELIAAGFSDGDVFTWAIYPGVDCDHIAGQTPIEATFTFHKDPADNKTPILAFSNEYLPNPDDETTLTISGYSGHVFTMTYDGTNCTAYPLYDMTNTFTAADFPDHTSFTITVYDHLIAEWAYLHPHSTCADLADETPLATTTVHFGISAPQDPPTDDDHPTNTGDHEPLTDYGPQTPATHTTVLERTGADITTPLSAAAVLILTGAALLIAGRRRHTN